MALSEKVFDIDHIISGKNPTADKSSCIFDSKIFECVIQDIVAKETEDRNAELADTTDTTNRKPCRTFVIATRAIHADGPPVFFRSYDCQKHNANKCTIWQAARCTSAAPNFFEPMYVEVPLPGGLYLDGGRLYNNPSELALQEAKEIWPTVKQFCIVSIGTGRQKPVDFIDIKDMESREGQGSLNSGFSVASGLETYSETASALFTPNGIQEACMALSESVEPIHQRVLGLADPRDPRKSLRYYRFNVERGMDTIEFQEWKARLRIGQITSGYMLEGAQQSRRDSCVQDLWKPSAVECMYQNIKLIITGRR